jgi:hypothetical protein
VQMLLELAKGAVGPTACRGSEKHKGEQKGVPLAHGRKVWRPVITIEIKNYTRL